jgi:hypothetical protein
LTVEKDLLIFLLQVTQKGPVAIKDVTNGLRVPADEVVTLLRKFQNEKGVIINDGKIETNFETRLKLAIKAIYSGADVERVSQFLGWQEFEEMAAVALSYNGYVTRKNVRFKSLNKRWEIDVVGCRKPFVVCIDCKHWLHGMHYSSLKRMVLAQIDRVKAFSEHTQDNLTNIECNKWSEANFIPVILSLIPSAYKFIDDVPVVPILGVQDFISQLPFQVDCLKCFHKKFSNLQNF